MSVKAIPGAAQALEHSGAAELLTHDELGSLLQHIPAEQRSQRTYLEHDELDTLVSRAASSAPAELVQRAQRTTNALLQLESAEERETFLAKILTPVGAIIGLFGAIMALFNPVLGAVIAIAGAAVACGNELAAWWHKSTVEGRREALLNEHRQALGALLDDHNRRDAARRARQTAAVAPPRPGVEPSAVRAPAPAKDPDDAEE